MINQSWRTVFLLHIPAYKLNNFLVCIVQRFFFHFISCSTSTLMLSSPGVFPSKFHSMISSISFAAVFFFTLVTFDLKAPAALTVTRVRSALIRSCVFLLRTIFPILTHSSRYSHGWLLNWCARLIIRCEKYLIYWRDKRTLHCSASVVIYVFELEEFSVHYRL